MRLGESQRKPAPESSSGKSKANHSHQGNGGALRQSVSSAVQTYLEQLDGEPGSDVYQMVLEQVEAPLLEEIMRYTRNNQTKASQMLGINRGTLRKKLKLYGLLSENDA